MSETETPTEITLDSVVTVDPTELSDEQSTFLKENADSLNDEQKETYKDVLTPKEEPIDIDKIEPEVRKTETKVEPKTPVIEEEEEDDEVVSKIVDKKLASVTESLKRLEKIEAEQEVDSFIRLNPNYTKYRDVALKYMAHSSYKNIPAKNIMRMVSADDMQKLGAQKEREAASKVKETKSGGSSSRPQGSGKVDISAMSDAEFLTYKQEVLQKPRV